MLLEQRMSGFSWVLLISLSLMWGFSFLFNALLLVNFSALWLVFFRLFIGGVVGFVIMLALRKSFFYSISDWLKMTGQGVLGVGIPFLMIIWAQHDVASGYTSVLVATAPLFGMVFSNFANVGDPMVTRKFVGVLIGVFGVALMLSESLLSEGLSTVLSKGFLSQLTILLACCFYAFGSVYTRRVRLLEKPPLVICTGTLLGGSLVFLPLALLVDGLPQMDYFLDLEVIFSLLFLGGICTGLAYLVFYPLLLRVGSRVFMCTLLTPWVAILLGNVFLAEPFEAMQIIGMAIIVFSLSLVDDRISFLFLSRRKTW